MVNSKLNDFRCLFDPDSFCNQEIYEFSDTLTCFIACPTSDEVKEELDIIKKVLEEEGIKPIIAAEYKNYNKPMLCTKICRNILGSTFCIALLTETTSKNKSVDKKGIEPNANVYFEYGLMTGVHKNIIPYQIIGQEIKFDIRHLEIHPYEPINQYNIEKFKDEIKKDVKDMVSNINSSRISMLKGEFNNYSMQLVNELKDKIDPIDKNKTSALILHFIPISALENSKDYNPNCIIENRGDFTYLNRLSFSSFKPNLKGVIMYDKIWKDQIEQNEFGRYIQFYDNGCVEYFTTTIFHNNQDKTYISGNYENDIIMTAQAIMQSMKKLNISLPVYVTLSLLGVKTVIFSTDGIAFTQTGVFTENNYYIVKENIINSYDTSPIEVMKPIINKVSNIVGFSRARNIDNQGNWRGFDISKY